MKNKINLVLGIFVFTDLIYKIVTCPNCEDNIFMFQVHGYVRILFLLVLMIGLLYPVYKDKMAKKEEVQKS